MDKELLLTALYCMCDDFCAQPQIACQLIRPGAKPRLPDVAVLSLALFQEFSGQHKEDDYWRYVRKHFESCFPRQLVDRSQYTRRRKNLAALANQLRQEIARQLTVPATYTGYHVIDALGSSVMTVTKFFRSRSFPHAGIGHCASKDICYAGYKTTLIVTLTGAIEDYVVGSAAPHDAPYGEALLSVQYPGVYLGDKGYILGQSDRAALAAKGIRLLTNLRSNMKDTLSKAQHRLLTAFRATVETTNGQLTELFAYGKPGGKSERGVLSRLAYKLAAHTVGLKVLQDFGLPERQLDVLCGV